MKRNKKLCAAFRAVAERALQVDEDSGPGPADDFISCNKSVALYLTRNGFISVAILILTSKKFDRFFWRAFLHRYPEFGL